MSLCKVASSVTFSVGIAAVSAVAMFAAPADALTLEAGGQSYDVIIEEASYDDLAARDDFATLVPWFGDQALAEALAIEAGNAFRNNEAGNLGLPYLGFNGPLFAFGLDQNGSVQNTAYVNNEIDPTTGLTRVDSGISLNSFAIQPYAVINLSAETIPTPALIPGLVGMGLAAIRKRNLTESDEV